MNEQDAMKAISEALEQAPLITAPEDFAARVMSRLPPQGTRRALPVAFTRTHYGRLAAACSLAVLMIAMALLAPLTAHSTMWITLQSVLFAEFVALALWLGKQRRRI